MSFDWIEKEVITLLWLLSNFSLAPPVKLPKICQFKLDFQIFKLLFCIISFQIKILFLKLIDAIAIDKFGWKFWKWAISSSLFLYFRLFNSVESKQMFNINYANDWIRTMDLWCQNCCLTWTVRHTLIPHNSSVRKRFKIQH